MHEFGLFEECLCFFGSDVCGLFMLFILFMWLVRESWRTVVGGEHVFDVCGELVCELGRVVGGERVDVVWRHLNLFF